VNIEAVHDSHVVKSLPDSPLLYATSGEYVILQTGHRVGLVLVELS